MVIFSSKYSIHLSRLKICPSASACPFTSMWVCSQFPRATSKNKRLWVNTHFTQFHAISRNFTQFHAISRNCTLSQIVQCVYRRKWSLTLLLFYRDGASPSVNTVHNIYRWCTIRVHTCLVEYHRSSGTVGYLPICIIERSWSRKFVNTQGNEARVRIPSALVFLYFTTVFQTIARVKYFYLDED